MSIFVSYIRSNYKLHRLGMARKEHSVLLGSSIGQYPHPTDFSAQFLHLMAKYYKLRVNDGFTQGTEAGVSVTIGATATLKASIKVRAKNHLQSTRGRKSQFSVET